VIATLLTIVFLIAMWVAVLAAPVLRNRNSSANRSPGRGGDSIKTFQRQLATLERTAPYRSPIGRSGGRGRSPARATPTSGPVRRPLTASQRAAHRRRLVLGGLIGTAVVTLGLALVVGGWFVLLHLLTDVLLVAYLTLLTRTLRLAAEREMKVAFLPHRHAGAEPTALLQQAARGSRG
jgi:hypothetical protein